MLRDSQIDFDVIVRLRGKLVVGKLKWCRITLENLAS